MAHFWLAGPIQLAAEKNYHRKLHVGFYNMTAYQRNIHTSHLLTYFCNEALAVRISVIFPFKV